MATTKEKIIAGVLIVLSSLGSAGLISLLDKGKPVYECESLGLVSDCVNGVKNSGKWCYYDSENARRYKNCPEGWTEKVTELEPISHGNVPSGVHGAKQYLCDVERCVPIG